MNWLKTALSIGTTTMVQSCVTSVGFPDMLEKVLTMVEDNGYLREDATDIDTLLEFKVEHERSWTAPRWMSSGDILFFYHTAKAAQLIKRLLREVAGDRSLRYLQPILEHAKAQSDRYSRTIFGCAFISGESHSEADEEDRQHFRSHIYAPLGIVHIFDHPLRDQVFAKFLMISRGGTLTPLHGENFKSLKEGLARENKLPRFLSRAEPGKGGFRSVDAKNWLEISCDPACRFIDESQLRVYMLNYLLSDLKDPRTPLLEECECFRNDIRTGLADYFIKVRVRWIPVEAKLNAATARMLPQQVNRYAQIDHFIPRKGVFSGRRFDTSRLKHCLVVDQLGLYHYANGEYVRCSSGKPIWRRDELSKRTITEIRTYLETLR